MRKILFKARDIRTGEWVEGYYLHIPKQNNHYILTGRIASYPVDIVHEHLRVDGFEWVQVDGRTVCQFTGLFDRIGKKIFDGDIVEYKFNSFDPTYDYRRYTILYNDDLAKFYAEPNDVNSEKIELNTLEFTEERAVVTDNIYNNLDGKTIQDITKEDAENTLKLLGIIDENGDINEKFKGIVKRKEE